MEGEQRTCWQDPRRRVGRHVRAPKEKRIQSNRGIECFAPLMSPGPGAPWWGMQGATPLLPAGGLTVER